MFLFELENNKKIDAHVHVLPHEKAEEFKKNYGNQGFALASAEKLIENMNKYNVSKAIMVPCNDSRLYYNVRKTNEHTASIVRQHPNRLIGFSDLMIKDAYSMHEAADELEYAVKELGLKGLKIHPSNLNIPADDLRLIPVLRKAADLKNTSSLSLLSMGTWLL